MKNKVKLMINICIILNDNIVLLNTEFQNTMK